MVLKHLRLTGTSGKYSIGKNINYLLNNNLPRHLVNKAIFLRRPKEKGRKWQTFLGKVTFNDIYLGTLEVSEVIWSKSQTENLFIPRDKTDEHVKLNNIKITRDSKEIPC